MEELAKILTVSAAGGKGRHARRLNDLRNNIRHFSAHNWGNEAEFAAAMAADEEANAAAAQAEATGFADVHDGDAYDSASDDDEAQPAAAAAAVPHDEMSVDEAQGPMH